jgi:hypothetical protein
MLDECVRAAAILEPGDRMELAVNILVYGATGMVGQGILLECLRDPTVSSVNAIGRTASGIDDAKLRDSA